MGKPEYWEYRYILFFLKALRMSGKIGILQKDRHFWSKVYGKNRNIGNIGLFSFLKGSQNVKKNSNFGNIVKRAYISEQNGME